MQEVVTTSRVKKMVGKFTHRVEGWSALSTAVGDHVESPQVELCGQQWRIRIFPGGSSHKHSSHISMYLANRSASPVSASYKLYVHNQETDDDDLIFQSNGIKLFETQGQGKIDGWGRDRFLPYHKCTDGSICQDDTIIFAVEITVFGDIETTLSQIMSMGSSLDQDLNHLFDNPTGSDVTVCVHGTDKEHFLHRVILSARSPVFHAMLTHSTCESDSGRIVLHDDDPRVVEYFFKFLYTDYLSEVILRENSASLLMMASKYRVSLLATVCEHCIVANQLEIGNAISILRFADDHGSTTMQIKILKFVQGHIEKISQQVEYLELAASQRSEIHERIVSIPNIHKAGSTIGLESVGQKGKFPLSCCIM